MKRLRGATFSWVARCGAAVIYSSFAAVADDLAAETIVPIHVAMVINCLKRLQPAYRRNVPCWKHCFCHPNINTRASLAWQQTVAEV